jgi:acyl dehydratase
MTEDTTPVRARVGEALPVLEVPIGVSEIVAMSIATRDFHPIHHDPERARAAGHPALFLNMMSTAGLVERFVRQWAGEGVRLARLSLKLGIPHYAGETLSLSGQVVGQGEDAAGPWTDIAFTASNPRGTHASGQVRVA